MSRLIDLDLASGTVWLSCPWDAQTIGTIKTIPDREFDKGTKRWSVPIAQIAVVVRLLEPLHFRFTPRMRDWWAEHRDPLPASGDGESREDVDVDPSDGYTVSRLNNEARRALTEHFGEVWIVAEIEGYDRNKKVGHAYFALVERAATGPAIASIRAVLFAATRRRIEEQLPEDVRLHDGARVRLKARVELYEPKGAFQLIIEGVDVEWAIGSRRRKRDEVLERLEREGVAGKNLELELGLIPLRIGLVTAEKSDAYSDFIDELGRSDVGFDVVFHPARMQGRDAEGSILTALRWFMRRSADFDVIVITRGGGSQGDLSAFDSFALGRAIGLIPIKIIVGIGHQRDRSVLDFVATSEKTPTAAARALVNRVLASLDRVSAAHEASASAAVQLLQRERARLARAASGCERATTARLSSARHAVDQSSAACERRSTSRLNDARRRVDLAAVRTGERGAAPLRLARSRVDGTQAALDRVVSEKIRQRGLQLEHIEAKLRLADPRRVLERGYALVRDHDTQQIVMDAAKARGLTAARIQLRDGSVRMIPEDANGD